MQDLPSNGFNCVQSILWYRQENPPLVLAVLQHFHKCLPFLIGSIYFLCHSQCCADDVMLADIVRQIGRNCLPESVARSSSISCSCLSNSRKEEIRSTNAPLALAGDPAQYHTGTHWRYRGVSRYPGDLIWPLCVVCLLLPKVTGLPPS